MSQPAAISEIVAQPLLREEELDQDGLDATAVHVTEILKDLRLTESVERALRETGHLPLRAVQVSSCGRLVILQGRVSTYYLKQIAQTAALGVPGVEMVCNDLEVE
jgi:osmotically-inducible protein OsmY